MPKLDLYDTLGVSSDATPLEIKKAYRKLVLVFHPDRPTGDEEAYELICNAYNILSNEDSRAEYDILFRLSKESGKSHVSLKETSKNFMEAQETSKIQKTEEEYQIEFDEIMDELDKKNGYDKDDTEAISEEEANRILADRELLYDQQNIELEPEKIEELHDENGKFKNDLFNAMWEAKHTQNELMPHQGNPLAYGGFMGNSVDYIGIVNIGDTFAEVPVQTGIEGQDFSQVDFDLENPMSKQLTKDDLLGAAQQIISNRNEDDYKKLTDEDIKSMLKERELEDKKFANREYSDFSTDPNCGGYGIFDDVGLVPNMLAFNDEDEDDLGDKYKKLLDLKEKLKDEGVDLDN